MTAMSNPQHSSPPLLLPEDGRQSAAALEIRRGASRLLRAHGFAAVPEMTLASGRRADIIGLSDAGVIVIVEVKSSIEDFRADGKWPEYRDYCDRLYFAVAPGFPVEILPEDTGLILADRYGGEMVRAAPELKLAAARRKALTIRIARTAAHRLHAAMDPSIALVVTTRGGDAPAGPPSDSDAS